MHPVRFVVATCCLAVLIVCGAKSHARPLALSPPAAVVPSPSLPSVTNDVVAASEPGVRWSASRGRIRSTAAPRRRARSTQRLAAPRRVLRVAPNGEARVDTVRTVRPERKSRGRALAYSFGATILPLIAAATLENADASIRSPGVVAGLFVGGIVVGPSVGHWYAEAHDRVRVGVLTRGIAGAVGTLGLLAFAADALDFEDEQSPAGTVGVGLAVAGGLTVMGSVLFDVLTAPQSATAFNDAHHASREGVSVGAAPVVDPVHGQYGVAVRVGL